MGRDWEWGGIVGGMGRGVDLAWYRHQLMVRMRSRLKGARTLDCLMVEAEFSGWGEKKERMIRWNPRRIRQILGNGTNFQGRFCLGPVGFIVRVCQRSSKVICFHEVKFLVSLVELLAVFHVVS